MRTLAYLAVALLTFGCAEGSVDNNGAGTGTTTSGGRADCIDGQTCVDPDCVDLDGDGYGTGCFLGSDCDDLDPQAAPNLTEVCDLKDNNCNGRVDENDVCGSMPPPQNSSNPPPNSSNPPPNSMTPDCVDADGDGYGNGCPAGVDCDDADPERFDGAPEACDNKDNDCDGTRDEDFSVGTACTAGLGICERAGTLQCSGDGTREECSASPGAPSTEVCNNLDDDCDGVADNGLNCNTCVEDANEPDNSSTAGTSINVGGSVSGQLCPGNVDWFRLGTYSAGQSVSVTAQFSHAQGDIDMEMYVGSTFEVGAYSGSNNESITRTLSKSGAVTIRLYFGAAAGVTGNSYTVQR